MPMKHEISFFQKSFLFFTIARKLISTLCYHNHNVHIEIQIVPHGDDVGMVESIPMECCFLHLGLYGTCTTNYEYTDIYNQSITSKSYTNVYFSCFIYYCISQRSTIQRSTFNDMILILWILCLSFRFMMTFDA